MHSDAQVPQPTQTGHVRPAELSALFVRTFLAAAGKAVIDLAPLKEAVCAFVRAAKERGDPPERVIVALKKLTTQAVSWRQSSAQQESLREAVVRFCLDEYYGPAALRTHDADRPAYPPPNLSD